MVTGVQTCALPISSLYSADFNADMCLFLEEFAEYREDFKNNRISAKRYKELQDKDLAYYSATMLEEKPED